jgi:hypothetical protein
MASIDVLKTAQKEEAWGGFIHPIAVCEECKKIIEGSPYIVKPDSTTLMFRHLHRLSFLILKKGGLRTYEIEGSPALESLLKWAGELWLMPSIDIKRDIDDVHLYIRQRLSEL